MSPLSPDSETRFGCSSCARCCRTPWSVLMTAGERERLARLSLDRVGHSAATLLLPAPGGLFALAKKPGSDECALLGPDNLCALHREFGEESKPTACQRFPYLHVASDERVWVSANYGCKAVQEGHGPPLSAQTFTLNRLFSKDISEADPKADTVYPLTPSLDVSTATLDAALEKLFKVMGDRLFPAMAELAAFAAASEGSAPPDQRPAGVGYAMALTLYTDIINTERLLDRLGAAWRLPKAMKLALRYESPAIGQTVDMAVAMKHPGVLPMESEALLLRLLRSRLRSRLVFKDVPSAVHGIGRLIVLVDVVLLFARAIAADRAIAHGDVLRALEAVELRIAHQRALSELAARDPRLIAAWGDGAVIRAAAALMAPA